MEADWKTELASLVADFPQTADIHSAALGQWRQRSSSAADVCAMFAPGFAEYAGSWLNEENLVGLLRAGVPVGVLPYSRLDGLLDQYLLRATGLIAKPVEATPNPLVAASP